MKKRTEVTLRYCRYCGESIDDKPKKSRFCSDAHRSAFWRMHKVLPNTDHQIRKGLQIIYTALTEEDFRERAIDILAALEKDIRQYRIAYDTQTYALPIEMPPSNDNSSIVPPQNLESIPF